MKKLFGKLENKIKAPSISPTTSQTDSSRPQSQISTSTKDWKKLKKDKKGQTPNPKDTAALRKGEGLALDGCSNCLDFDPTRASQATDGLTEESWARKEYNIDPRTPSGVIKVKDAHSILQTAQLGCIHCSILSLVLVQIQPDWQEEDCFLTIYVAQGLPVVVRLLFGKTGVQRYDNGFQLQPGRVLDLTFDLVDPSKSGVEFEIFHPPISKALPEGSDPNVQLVVKQLSSRIGHAVPRSMSNSDQSCFDFIGMHLNDCLTNHMSCIPAEDPPVLPDRVIWIRSPTRHGMQLIDSHGLRANYLTLSYCWGPHDDHIYKTDMFSLENRKFEMIYDDLPPLFRDVVVIARKLGIDYVWIDRLCIVQGPSGDFELQAPKMGEIYGNSLLTITSASAQSENDHILIPRDPQWDMNILNLKLGEATNFPIYYRRRAIAIGKEHQGGDYGKVSTRAWIWQERLLSTRNVFYTPAALKFECRCASYWEGSDPRHTGHSWSSRIDHNSHFSWTRLVEEFSSRDITYASDRMAAIEAVMKRVAIRTSQTPAFGMWKESLIETLAWKAEPKKRDLYASTIHGPYTPSWSWTSIDGPISYQTVHAFQGPLYDVSPFQYQLKMLGVDGSTGDLMVEGRLITVTVRMRQEAYSEDMDQQTIYEIGDNEQAQDWIKIKADTLLRRYDAKFLHGEALPGTQRIPAGEPVPTEPWTSDCYVLLLGIGQARCECLVLGLSERKLNCFERIGSVGNIPPIVFDKRAIGQFVIV